jgi:hypothetical protein
LRRHSEPVRVVRSQETYWAGGPQRGEARTKTTEWNSVTTLPATVVPTASVVHWGHARWDIENYGFNELVQGW